jgi:hypothetical protein
MRVACGQRKQGNWLEISNESFSPRLKAKQSARRNSLFLGGINPFEFRAEKRPAQSPEQILPTSP